MIKKNYGGLRAAFSGIKETIIFEKSFRIMLLIGAVVVVAMLYFPTSRLEKIILLLITFSVLVLELINSTVERIMNVVTKEQNDEVRVIKDLMAAIVLLASLGAATAGIFIFLPYVMELLVYIF